MLWRKWCDCPEMNYFLNVGWLLSMWSLFWVRFCLAARPEDEELLPEATTSSPKSLNSRHRHYIRRLVQNWLWTAIESDKVRLSAESKKSPKNNPKMFLLHNQTIKSKQHLNYTYSARSWYLQTYILFSTATHSSSLYSPLLPPVLALQLPSHRQQFAFCITSNPNPNLSSHSSPSPRTK